jgi:hypothetical protein
MGKPPDIKFKKAYAGLVFLNCFSVEVELLYAGLDSGLEP